MQVTRNSHARFMAKAIPLLALAYVIQSLMYLKFAPSQLATDVVACLGLALTGLFSYYLIYDQFHQVELHQNYLKIHFKPLRLQHEFLYRDITDVQIRESKASYHHVFIHLRCGTVHKLAHVDKAQDLRTFLLNRA